ncbi:hypothetical protein Rleg10DRAFT_6667 [Rhizobium leguminosarum bv. trifolii WSM2012]|nr:hypothetical protein Rleg10DRAFT_6667 [Rhizobium leguminosarum bv. trifolii WSM2012]
MPNCALDRQLISTQLHFEDKPQRPVIDFCSECTVNLGAIIQAMSILDLEAAALENSQQVVNSLGFIPSLHE